MKKAFTLSEALLTMTILGVIAAVMVTTLKPGQYKQQAFRTLKQKAYTTVDEATQSVLADCTTGMDLSKIHGNCNRTNTTHTFGTTEAEIYNKFLRGTVKTTAGQAVDGCAAKTGWTNLKLRNGICLYFKSQGDGIWVDVNGTEGPDDTTDQFTISLDNTEGVSSDMP